MDKIPDEVFAILTAKQKEVYLLRMEGMTFAEIGRKLGKSVNAVRENYRGVERRTREYTAYQRAETRNNEVVDFPMTRGELDSVYMRLSQNSQPNSDTPDMNSRKER